MPPEQQQFNPIEQFKSRFQGAENYPDEKIQSYLSNPNNFRTSFPEYKSWSDQQITAALPQQQLNLPGGTSRLQQAAQGLPSSLTQPTEFEKNANPSPWQAGNEVAGMELRSAGLPSSLSDIPRWASGFVKPVAWGSMVRGPEAGSPESTALGRLASFTGTAAGIVGPNEIRPGLSAARDTVADVARTPDNALTPTATTLSRVGGGITGAGTGALLGHTLGPEGMLGEGYLGYRVGSQLGPLLADKVLPNRPPPTDFMGGAFSDYAGESGKAIPVSKGPGPYTGPASVPKGNVTPFGGATSSANPTGNPPVPPVPQGSTTPFPQAPIVRRPVTPALTTTDEGVVIAPEPRQPAPGVNPNMMGSVPRQDLTGMAASGTPGAGQQLQQLGQPIIYTPPSGYPGPRSEPPPPQFQPNSPQPPQPQNPLNLPSQQPMVESTESAPQSVRPPKPKPKVEPADEAARRGASGVNPVQRSVRRNIEKNRKRAEQ